ncbi:MAG: spermidine/putrescine ABC transporter permease PotC, partial [Pseudomonadota bacterium]
MASGPFNIRHYAGFSFMTIVCLLILYLPLLVVLVYSFNDSLSITRWGGFSLRWYVELFTGVESAKYKQAAFYSLTIALAAGLSATVLA